MSERLGTQLQSGGLEQSIHTGLLGRGMFAGASLDLNFAATKNIGPLVTFTRASTATFIDSVGVLQTAVADVPRFDHNPTTGESLGLLVEEQRTNLLLLSGNLYETGTGGGSWVYQTGTMSDNTQVAPDGTTTADTLTTTGGAISIYQSATVTASTTYTGSAYVRLGTMQASDFKVAVYNNSTPGFIAIDVAPSQTPTSSDWTRISYSFTTPAGCTSVRWYPFRNSAGLNSCTVHLWGAQLEAGAFATSYIPTTTAAATRSADVASITGTNFSSWYRQDEGTVFASVRLASLVNTYEASFTDNSNNNHHFLRYVSGQHQMVTKTGGVDGTSIYSDGGSGIAIARNAYGYKTSSFAISANGIAGAFSTTTANTVPTVDRLNIGMSQLAAATGNLHISRLTYWPTRLPNSTLQAITL